MATAYKYVERKAEDNINWAEVGSNVNNMLNEEMRVRTEKKSAIDAASREYQKVLNSVPVGENSELNKFALGFSDDLQKQMLMQETLLKSGQLSPSQYTMMRQNLTDGTDQGFNLLQDYNNEYEAKMSLLGDDVAYGDQLSGIDIQIQANVEAFSNFRNSKLVINPETGLVSMGKMIDNPDDPDGPRILDPNRNNLVSVQNLRNRIKTTITKYDVVGNAEQFQSTLGKDVRQTIDSMGTKYTAGTLKKISDIRQREGGFSGMKPARIAEIALEMGVEPSDIQALSLFDEAAKTWAQSQMQGGSYNTASTLLDFAKFTPDGLQYTTTLDVADTLDENGKRKQNVILLQSENGRTVTKMTDEQNSVAERVLISQLGVQLDYEETTSVEKIKSPPPVYRPNAAELSLKETKKKNISDLGNVAQLWYGDSEQMIEAQRSLRVLNPNIKSTKKTKDGIMVTYTDGTQEPLNYMSPSDKELTIEEWVVANANYLLGEDITDIPTLLKSAGIPDDATLSTSDDSFDEAGDVPVELTTIQKVKKKINSDGFLDKDFFLEKEVKKSTTDIMAVLDGYGASLNSSSWASGRNYFTIVGADGVVSPKFNTDQDDINAAEAEMKLVLKFVKNHMTEAAAQRVIDDLAILGGAALGDAILNK